MRATITGGDGATGHTADYVVVSNPSSKSCSVMGPPRLELRDRKTRLVSRSKDRQPFMAWPKAAPHHLTIDAGSNPDDWERSPRVRRTALVVIAQGPCPGGIVPDGATLHLILADVGVINVDRFEGELAFDYRCDEAQPPPAGPPDLLIGDLWGPDDFE